MKAKLVKFDDDGTQCKRDIEYLRRHPECGIPFIQDKPFKPDNPKHKFRPLDRTFSIDVLDKIIPHTPIIPPAPPIGKPPKIGEAVGPPLTNEFLPQDYTNYQQLGRRLIGEHLEYERSGGYARLPVANAETDLAFPVPRIGNNNYSHETPVKPTRRIGEVELEDFGAGVGEINEAPPPIRQTRIRPLADPRDTEFATTERLNLGDLPEEIKEYIAQKINVRDITDPELLEFEGEEVEDIGKLDVENEEVIKKTIKSIDEDILDLLRIKSLTGNFDEDALDFLNESKDKLEKHLEKLQKTRRFQKIIKESKPARLKPRGMTDEELIDAQIEQVTRNLPQKEAKKVEKSIRKGKAKVKPTEQEMFPIEPESEELQILKEIEKILKPNETELTIRQKENLVKEMETRGVTRQRVEEVLNMYEAYDPALEQAIGRRAGTEEERLLRRLRSSIREMPRRDTNLLPVRQEEIELRPDTPLTRGRTDIAPGRSRIQKVMDKTAGKLPEELRNVYKSAQRNAEAFNENVRTRSLEAIQRIQSTSTRIFGQKYTSIVEPRTGVPREIEMGAITAPDGNINVRPPVTEDITGIRPNDLQALDFDPLGADYQETFVGRAKPELTYAERLQRVRTGALSREAGVAGAGAVGGILIGFGVAELMGQAGVDNKYAIAATAGGAGGAGARILTMAGTRALTRGTTTAVAETATYTAIRGGTSILRGAAEGAIVGLALMPVDMMLNDAFINAGMSHTAANLTSGAIAGTTATALTTIGLASLGAAPETLGMSLIVGGLAMAATSIIGIFTGQEQDRKEREAKAEAERAKIELNSTAQARQRLLETLPNYDYNFDRALEAFADKNSLGIDNDTWTTFSNNSRSMFVPRPNNSPPTPTSGEPPTGEQKEINDKFSRYITHELINRVCTDGGCEELRRHDNPLTLNEMYYLSQVTNGTWKAQADMQVEMSVQELQYTRQRIGEAQTEMLNAWNNEQKVANQLDPYIVETASLDSTFRERYDLALKLDAQQRVVDAYKDNQTRIEQLPKNIRDMANLDPDFDNMIHHYYNSMETTAGQLAISVPQLVELQDLTGEAQKDKYEEFQFNNIKQDPVVVAEAQEIASEEDQVRQAGFYDIDQAFLETDPTAITTWKPSDSQILQAHSAGMNLNEYVEYMHQLAMGEAGDYSKLPKYTDEQLRASGLLDYSHFQDELQMAGYRKDLYLYNPDTRQFTLNPNITNSAIPSTQQTFISRYTPRYLLEARQEYADMIHGLNQSNQAQVDNYNNNLMKELSVYGRHYDEMVAEYNNELLYQGRDDLLYYDIGKIYDLNKLEFNPISEKLGDAVKPVTENVVSQNEATKRQLNIDVRAERKKQAAESYGLTVKQYGDMKRDIVSKGIVNPTQEQVNQAVAEVKSSPADATPIAS